MDKTVAKYVLESYGICPTHGTEMDFYTGPLRGRYCKQCKVEAAWSDAIRINEARDVLQLKAAKP